MFHLKLEILFFLLICRIIQCLNWLSINVRLAGSMGYSFVVKHFISCVKEILKACRSNNNKVPRGEEENKTIFFSCLTASTVVESESEDESFVRSDFTIARKVDFRSNRPDVAVRFSMFNLALVSLLLFVAVGWH